MMLEMDVFVLVILDFFLVNETAVPTIALIRERYARTKVCILTHHISEEIVRAIAPYQPEGILSKGESMSSLLDSVNRIVSGSHIYDPIASTLMLRILGPLLDARMTPDILDLPEPKRLILQLTADGYTAQEIALRLTTSVANVNLIRRDLKNTFGFTNIADLVSYYIAAVSSSGQTALHRT
jgi:DNA-binding NarL/FixJ family response regulator